MMEHNTKGEPSVVRFVAVIFVVVFLSACSAGTPPPMIPGPDPSHDTGESDVDGHTVDPELDPSNQDRIGGRAVHGLSSPLIGRYS